jgi:hypothetical protein
MSKKIIKNDVEKIIKKLNNNIKNISTKNEEFKQNLEKLEENQKENNLKHNEILPKFLLFTDKLKELNNELEEIENQLCKYKKKQKLILLTLNNKNIYQYLKDLSKFKENNQYFYLLFEFLGYNIKKTFDEVFIFFQDNFFSFLSMLEYSNNSLLNNKKKYSKIKNLLVPIIIEKKIIQNPLDQIVNYIQYSINLFDLKEYKLNILNEIDFQEKFKNEKFILLKNIEIQIEENLFKEIYYQNNLKIINNFIIEFNIYNKKYDINDIEKINKKDYKKIYYECLQLNDSLNNYLNYLSSIKNNEDIENNISYLPKMNKKYKEIINNFNKLKQKLDTDRTYLDSYRGDMLETKADEEENNNINKSICDEKTKINKHHIIRSLVTVDNNVNEDEVKKRIKNERDIFFDSIILLHKNNEDKCGCSCQ